MSEYSKSNSNPQSPTVEEDNQVLCHRRTQSLPPRLLMELGRPPQGWIPIYFSNAITRTYRFHTGLGGDIVVHETMLETPLNNIVPSQLLQLWIAQEKDLVRELVALGEMVPSPWQQRMLQLLERHFRRIGDYTQVIIIPLHLLILFDLDVQSSKMKIFERLNFQLLYLHRRWNPLTRRRNCFEQASRKINRRYNIVQLTSTSRGCGRRTAACAKRAHSTALPSAPSRPYHTVSKEAAS